MVARKKETLLSAQPTSGGGERKRGMMFNPRSVGNLQAAPAGRQGVKCDEPKTEAVTCLEAQAR